MALDSNSACEHKALLRRDVVIRAAVLVACLTATAGAFAGCRVHGGPHMLPDNRLSLTQHVYGTDDADGL